MAPGFSKVDQALCVKMFRIFLVFLELQFINSFIDVTLNAEKIFGRVEWAAILNSVVSVVLLLLFYKILGVWVLVLTLFIGKLIEFLITIVFVRKTGIRYSFIWTEKSFDAKSFFKLMFTTSGYVAATQIYNMIFTAMATLLPQGTYAIFKYVQQISQKASGILLAPLSTVFFSHFSDHVASGKKELEHKMKTPVLYSFVLGFTFTSLIILFGKEVLYILFKSKAMSFYFLGIGYWMLIINFIGFTTSAVGSIYRKATVSMGNGKQLYNYWILAQLLSAFLAYFFITPMGWIGLSIVSVFASSLLACCSVFAGWKVGVSIAKTINFQNLISIIISFILFVSLSLLCNYFLITSSSLFLTILYKFLLTFSIAVLLLYIKHREVCYKILSFVKISFMKHNMNAR